MISTCWSYVNEKTDVYNFGMLLLALFVGQHLFLDGEQNKVIKVIDKATLEERIDHKQFLAFAEVALSCISDIAEDRPTTIDARKQLRVIYEYLSPPLLISMQMD